MNGKDSRIDVSQAKDREEVAAAVAATEAAATKALAEMAARSEQNAKAAAGPQVIAEIVIKVFDDGNLSVDAPFDNQLLVRGALSCAEDVVKMMGAQIMKQRREQGLQVVRKGEPWYARLARQARGG